MLTEIKFRLDSAATRTYSFSPEHMDLSDHSDLRSKHDPA